MSRSHADLPRIVVSRDEPEFVRWVAAAVRADLKRVPRSNLRGLPRRIVAGSSHRLVREVLAREKVPAFEGYVVEVVRREVPTLVVAAHHSRGTMYGLLEISRRLGVDPLEYFTDFPPRNREGRWEFPIHSEAPAFRYRGLFLNQEDLLIGWKKPHGPVPSQVYDLIFLSALRLGANMILPATYVSPESPVLDLAARRGLVLAQHHFQVLGTDVGRLTPARKKTYSFVRYPDRTERVWRRAIRAYRDRETVWTLGYRGSDDCAFWLTEPGTFTDARKGRIISDAMQVQYRLLREELGGGAIPCVYYLYRENQILYQQGHITVPEGVSVVWCDNGYGTMESYFRDGHELTPPGTPIPLTGKPLPAWPDRKQVRGGIYHHVSFYDCSAPNRVQYVSPAKIQQVYTKAVRKGLTDFLLINVGNVREFVLSARAACDVARSPARWLRNPGRHVSFVADWCRYYFGKERAKQAANAYALLYDAHWWWKTDPGKCYGDNLLRSFLDEVIASVYAPDSAYWWQPRCYLRTGSPLRCLAIIRAEGAQSLGRWKKAVRAAERVEGALTGEPRRFFHEDVTLQCRRGLGAMEILVLAAEAVEQLLALRTMHGNDEEFPPPRSTNRRKAKCLDLIGDAQSAARDWEQALRGADRPPKWTDWSRGDCFILPHVVHEQLRGLEHLLRGNVDIATFVCDIYGHMKGADDLT
jgi:hypothetical protein